MTSADASPTSYLLHVCPASPRLPWVERLQNRITQETLPVGEVGDVYRALARIARAAPKEIAAVLVCVEVIGPEEWEFFALVTKHPNSPRLYVYGDERSRAKIDRALGLGAFAILTDATFVEVSTSLCHKSSESRPARPELKPPLSPAPVYPAVQPELTPTPVTDEASLVEGEVVDSVVDLGEPSPDAEKDEPVRVPWIRYGDRPARARPEPRDLPAAQPRSIDPRPLRPAPREPLLTEEELRALLGDDIAVIAPRRRPPHSTSDAPSEGKP